MAELEQALGEQAVTEEVTETATPETQDTGEETPKATEEETTAAEGETTDTESTTGEEDGSPPEPTKSEEPATAPVAALIDERVKRQSAEDRAQKAEQRLAALENPGTETPELDVFEDQKGYGDAIKTAAVGEMQQITQPLFLEIARLKHDDFDQVIDEFGKMAQENPRLVQQANETGNPYEAAYQHVKLQAQAKLANDPEYINKLVEEKVELRLKALEEAKLSEDIDKVTAPPSLSGQRSTSTGSKEFVPASLDQALN